MKLLRTGGVAATAVAVVMTLGAAPAQAQVEQDGLINVNIGDVTVLEDVRVAVAAQIAAAICGVKVGPIAILGTAVDAGGDPVTVCEARTGDIVLEQN